LGKEYRSLSSSLCNPKHVTEVNIEEGIEGRGRRARRRKQVLNDSQETRRYKKLKEKL
jgi:hypothetical protein